MEANPEDVQENIPSSLAFLARDVARDEKEVSVLRFRKFDFFVSIQDITVFGSSCRLMTSA